MPRLAHGLLLSLLILISSHAPFGAVRTFRTLPGDQKNLVQFVSDATLERIVGRTNNISGSAELDFDNLKTTAKAAFDVELRTLDTGIAMRNQDMRTNYLETDKFPRATFVLKRIISADGESLLPEQPVQLVAEGEFTVHGVSKTYQVPITLTYAPAASGSEASERLYGGTGDLVNVSAAWNVRLSDHGIVRPSFLFMRLAEEQHVSVSFALTNTLPSK